LTKEQVDNLCVAIYDEPMGAAHALVAYLGAVAIKKTFDELEAWVVALMKADEATT
jgi:hypothetical protein